MPSNDKFDRETPLGNLYGGYMNDYPLSRGGTLSNAYLGLGDLMAIARKYNLPNENPSYNFGVNIPNGTELPGYYNELNTPLGKLYGGTGGTNPNINVGFQPSDQTMAYISALQNLLK